MESAINPTTVQVKLATPTAGVKASDFKVTYNGSTVAVSEAKLVVGTNDTYNLTVASLNGKTGTVVVNGKASVSFDYTAFYATAESKSATKIEVKFNKEVNPATVANTKFALLDKNNAVVSGVTVASAVTSTDNKTVTLTLTGGTLVNTSAPYKLNVASTVTDKSGTPLSSGTIAVVSATSAPTVVSAKFTSDTTVDLTFDRNINDVTDPLAATDVIVRDLTSNKNLTVNSVTDVDGTSKVVTVTLGGSDKFELAKNYRFTFNANTIKDELGTENSEAIVYNTQAPVVSPAKPKATAVQYVQSKSNPTEIDAIVTFDNPIQLVGSDVSGDLVLVEDTATTIAFDNKTALTSTTPAETQKTRVEGLELKENQI